MDARRWAVIESLYHAALGKEPDERSTYLAAACAEDLTLRSEVESLLCYVDARLSSPADRAEVAKLWGQIADIPLNEASTPHLATDAETGVPSAIGPYRILRLLGEGGMGTVYEAEQEHPRRTVALKVIRPGVASPELLRRFERESQALARLQHPGIAQIFEAGTADSGFGPQPYFAMEFIRGKSLLAYNQAHQLNTRQRLELMAKVCEAVHHAHQRGIIHRDLKPANILVDESGQPKILDFGVARAVDSDAQTTRRTDVGQIVGTLAYMSPEQVLGDPLELDTRSDVYSLGVILFELLADRLPYTISGQVHQAGRTIREDDPARLSSVSRAYRGDIETIVSKALEKDKARRYPSAAGMAADIQRYLNDEPISARPPSTAYQLQKFTRRHKALVGGIAMVFVVLIAGIIASTWEATRARRAEQAATTQAASAKAVNDFLQNDLLAQASANSQASPETKPDPDLKVRTALERAAARIAGKFDKQPLVEASIRQTIGDTYRALGLYPDAQRQMERAVEIRRRVLGEQQNETLASMQKLAVLYGDEGNYAQAEILDTRVLELRTRTLGEENPDTLDTMDNSAGVYSDEGKYPQAEALFTKILGVQRGVLGEKDSNTLDTMNDLAVLYFDQGKYERAEPLFIKTLEIRRQTQGEEHPDTLISMNNLAALYKDQAKYGQAELLDVKVLEVRRRVLGMEHPDTLASMNNLATVYQDEGKYEQAESLNVKVLEVRRRVLGMEHPDTLTSMNNLATVYQNEGRYEQAEPLYTKVLEFYQRQLGEQHPYTLLSMNNLALLYRRRGRYAQAELLFTKVLEVRRRTLGSQHPDTLISMNDLALLYLYEQKYSAAEALLREPLKTEEQRISNSWARFNSQSMLGASLAAQKKYAEAEPLLLSGYQGMLLRNSTTPAPNRSKLELAGKWIVELYRDWGKPEKAAEWKRKLRANAGTDGKR